MTLRNEVIKALTFQGFIFKDDAFYIPEPDKSNIRNLHLISRAERITEHINFTDAPALVLPSSRTIGDGTWRHLSFDLNSAPYYTETMPEVYENLFLPLSKTPVFIGIPAPIGR